LLKALFYPLAQCSPPFPPFILSDIIIYFSSAIAPMTHFPSTRMAKRFSQRNIGSGVKSLF
jgi:hypothetical protein